MIGSTDDASCPRALSCVIPLQPSAILLRYSTRSSASMVSTASPTDPTRRGAATAGASPNRGDRQTTYHTRLPATAPTIAAIGVNHTAAAISRSAAAASGSTAPHAAPSAGVNTDATTVA